MARSMQISTARAMLNLGDPFDIDSPEPKRFAICKTMTVWLSTLGRFSSEAEKEFRWLYPSCLMSVLSYTRSTAAGGT